MDLIFRFIIGGLIVSLFAIIGDVIKPRTFAGLFAVVRKNGSISRYRWGVKRKRELLKREASGPLVLAA
jgi:hypothetical protein